MCRILVVDDEKDVVSLLKDYFEINGYEVQTAYSGREAIDQVLGNSNHDQQKEPDIILLDVNMPGEDGISVCKRIRDYVSCPILFLTARIEDSDKIQGFAAGGDDYVIKPFSIEELGARVAAHLRREQRNAGNASVRLFGDIVVDYSAKMVAAKGGRDLGFVKKEFEIIELLSMNPGQVFDKERIYERIWGYDAEGSSTVVAEHIRRIRAKLSEAGEAYHVETVWGMGYRWIK